ncbi:hypothetical protein C0Q70_03119 [Pomacea canaliculata]|uniref:Uncharacterized protein n=1 Tax=Pomacea canaliculata TaxID=400727 RepID=A0A2T7PRU8_POMCA|nr:hypothetical protein C0Q70_03119 [Pomacea canaliculata]
MECVLGCEGRVRMGSSGLCYRRHPLTVSHGVCDLLGADWNVRQVSPLGLLPVRTLPATVYRPVHDTSIQESRGPSVYVLLLAATWLSSVLLFFPNHVVSPARRLSPDGSHSQYESTMRVELKISHSRSQIKAADLRSR